MFIRMAMKHLPVALILLLAVAGLIGRSHAQDKSLASTPPMGWNSWDAYGPEVTEEDFRANMIVLTAQLKEFGWQYVVVDAGWYLTNPEDSFRPESLEYTVNAHGQYEPAPNRFPSSVHGAGFKPLADDVHRHGLKFGIHVMRGIPKQTFMANARIGLTRYRASAAADPADICPWNPDNFGVKANLAGQAWYDALMKQYASWGVDYIKVDCIAAHPYKPGEIKMIHTAIERSGRPMVLSLSPGPTALDNGPEVARNAQLWRISDDVWDLWEHTNKTHRFPQSVKAQFPVLAKWAPFTKPGNWPDADMLPIGELRPTPGTGKARATHLTEDEQRTMVTLWAIARSPLFIGGNLTQMDEATKSLLTNPAIIEMDQHSTNSILKTNDGDVLSWVSTSTDGKLSYLAIFNLGDMPVHIDNTLATYGFIQRAQYRVRDLWQRKELGTLNAVTEDLPPHASVVYSLRE
jgi:hypothetical protein